MYAAASMHVYAGSTSVISWYFRSTYCGRLVCTEREIEVITLHEGCPTLAVKKDVSKPLAESVQQGCQLVCRAGFRLLSSQQVFASDVVLQWCPRPGLGQRLVWQQDKA